MTPFMKLLLHTRHGFILDSALHIGGTKRCIATVAFEYMVPRLSIFVNQDNPPAFMSFSNCDQTYFRQQHTRTPLVQKRIPSLMREKASK